jgi:hypothetical protein
LWPCHFQAMTEQLIKKLEFDKEIPADEGEEPSPPKAFPI